MKKLIKTNYFLLKKITPIFNKIIIFITIMLNIGCGTWNYIPIHFNIEQGISLSKEDMQKIYIGSTKSYIFANIGPPILQDLFGRNQFYYVFCRYNTKNGLEYQTIELSFDSNDILVAINIL